MAETKTIGKRIDGLTCYTDNVSELLKQFRLDYTDPVTGALKPGLGFQEVIEAVNTLFAKVKETASECEGVDISIPAPGGAAGNILNLLFQAIGLEIFDED